MAPSLQPVGSGPNFSYARAIRPDQLSPRSSSSSAVTSSSESDESDNDSSDSGASRPITPARARPLQAQPVEQTSRIGRPLVTLQAAFIVEELSDFVDDDDERLNVIRPHTIEYADSERSRSRSRPPEIDPTVMHNLGNLNCSSDSDETDLDENEYTEMLLRRREQKRRWRMTSGSIGKRTISESIGSDTDLEDLRAFLGSQEIGSSFSRRLRRKVGDRRSLQFQDPPPPRIEELEEPDSGDDEIHISETLARELPYYEYLTMEVDSP